jgi:hypothetical protein
MWPMKRLLLTLLLLAEITIAVNGSVPGASHTVYECQQGSCCDCGNNGRGLATDCGFIGIFSTDASGQGHANASFIGRFGDPSSVINVNAGNFGTVLATAGALLGCAR